VELVNVSVLSTGDTGAGGKINESFITECELEKLSMVNSPEQQTTDVTSAPQVCLNIYLFTNCRIDKGPGSATNIFLKRENS